MPPGKKKKSKGNLPLCVLPPSSGCSQSRWALIPSAPPGPPRRVSLPLGAPKFPGQWLIVDGKVSKFGIPTSKGHTFRGLCLENGVPHGKGVETFPNGTRFHGTFEEGKRCEGKLHFPKGSIYQGSFKEGRPHGQGELKLPNGDVYRGNFINGCFSGHGCLETTTGIHYEGCFENGYRQGRGRAVFKDGSTYDGEWHQGLRHGQGMVTTAKGATYSGMWHHDKRHGEGCMVWPSGYRWKGLWENDAPSAPEVEGANSPVEGAQCTDVDSLDGTEESLMEAEEPVASKSPTSCQPSSLPVERQEDSRLRSTGHERPFTPRTLSRIRTPFGFRPGSSGGLRPSRFASDDHLQVRGV